MPKRRRAYLAAIQEEGLRGDELSSCDHVYAPPELDLEAARDDYLKRNPSRPFADWLVTAKGCERAEIVTFHFQLGFL